jgi:hypothetical protein
MSHGMSGTMAKVAGSLQHCTLWRDCELVAQRMVLDSTVSRDEPFFARNGCLFLLFFFLLASIRGKICDLCAARIRRVSHGTTTRMEWRQDYIYTLLRNLGLFV